MEDLESLGLKLVGNTTCPTEMKIWSGLDFEFWLPRIPPPLLPIETSHGGLRKFGSEVGQEYLPPPPENEKLVRTWDFVGGNGCVETNNCIPHGYRLVEPYSGDIPTNSCGGATKSTSLAFNGQSLCD